MSRHTLTVKELIEKLQAVVAADATVNDYKVIVEGCDCFGDAKDVDVNAGTKTIIITRD